MLRALPPSALPPSDTRSRRAFASYHGSSHFSSVATNPQYSHWTKEDAFKVRQECFPEAKTVLSYGGLQMIPPRVGPRGSKDPQFNIFTDQLKSEAAEVCVLMALSNDYDKLIFKDGKPLELRPEAISKWDDFQNRQKRDFVYKNQKLLKTTAAKSLNQKLDEYMNILCTLLKNTKVEIFVHTSVLERQYFNINKSHLDILWASLNSLLHDKLKKLTTYNSEGKLISIKFISLTWQYHSDEPFVDFRENEWTAWEKERKKPGFRAKNNLPPAHLTHRNREASIKLFKFINGKVEVYVDQLNCSDTDKSNKC